MRPMEWKPLALALVGRAVLAPSSHNSQPWLFRITEDNTIDLYADRTRALPVNDPDDRELVISCGCALFNLRAAAASHGLEVHVEPCPPTSDPDWLARLSVTGESRASGVSTDEAALADHLDRRRTYRKRFASRDVTVEAVARLEAAARAEGAWLRPLTGEAERQQAAALVAEGDAAQWAQPSWRRELAAWMHPRRRGDGLTVPALAAPVAQVVVRTFDMGGGVGARDRELAEGSPLLAVLGTPGDTPRDWLQAGQALQRTLLEACDLGLQASYLNQPIEIASLRTRLADLVGGGHPQLLLRMGYPTDDIPAAPRRPVDDVVDA